MQSQKIKLLAFAEEFARKQGAPVNTIIKELLHYEILFALSESGAANNLTFQGGSALRLCHNGMRYSEDLDFASGYEIPDLPIENFSTILSEHLAETYDLVVKVNPHTKENKDDKVIVDRWKATISVPNPDKSIAQSQLINIEIASIPSYEPTFKRIAQNYKGLPEKFNQMMIAVESESEILADKIVALGARKYIKHRDIWDIKFLQDKGVNIDFNLVNKKLSDYGLDKKSFDEMLSNKLLMLGEQSIKDGFKNEMSRFTNRSIQNLFSRDVFIEEYMNASINAGNSFLLGAHQEKSKDDNG